MLALLALTLLAVYLCWRLVEPFVPALTWALVLAVVFNPLHERIRARVPGKSVVAALAVLLVTVAVAVPSVLVAQKVAEEAVTHVEKLKGDPAKALMDQAIKRYPELAPTLRWLKREMDGSGQVDKMATFVVDGTRRFVSGSVYFVVGALVTLYLLFYFFRDKDKTLRALRRFAPLSDDESDKVFADVRDTIYAIVYGTLAVSLVQGVLGGMIFWWLELPSPLLWGAVMAVLAILPVLGASIVWAPAAVALALGGEWDKALILAFWGSVVIGLIDNLLYPLLVKGRMRLHTVPVFIAVIGGLLVFGTAGVVLGPVVLAMAKALVEVWRQRLQPAPPVLMEDGSTAVSAAAAAPDRAPADTAPQNW
ncbi:AI-2E family transporter [Schlegelella aquatica]|uniref:AI-2E family transporter n=1 Tax=Caldimonas aquatica TaxID=376175 RepID=UPI003751F4A0